MTISGKIAVLVVLLICVHDSVGRGLDDYILKYDNVDYSTTELHERHMRHRRSTNSPVHVNINAFDRNFKLVLRQDSKMFSQSHKLTFNGADHSPDLSFLYSGHVEGHPGSKVHGAIIEGIFRGKFTVPSDPETYHVEKSRIYFDKPVYHSVIFRESDMVIDPYKEKREREVREARDRGSCGNDRVKEWMKEQVAAEYIPANRAKRSEMTLQEVQTGENKYTAQANTADKTHSRRKRETLGDRNSCFMSLTSDPMFWDYYLAKANGNEEVARDEILAFFASHINAINDIYGRTVFEIYDRSKSYSGVQFTVQKTKIMSRDADCSGQISNRFCEKNIDVSNFLNLNSLDNHDLFCLAYVFTYRDFSGGTLGLAWVGAASKASGGLCEKNKAYVENNKNVRKSLNTGIVTIINYGKTVPNKVSQLTFAHEVGHNFGSPHDSGTLCAPYGTTRTDSQQGNYIMFSSATMGDRPHNSHFSPCSLDNITLVLEAVVNENYGKVNCFKSSGSFCGNGLVEEGEQCDCGFDSDCTDSCCHPKISNPSSSQSTANECTLKKGVCSPTQGPCCTDQCQFIGLSQNKTCRYAEDCFSAAICNGMSAYCPNSTLSPDGSFCNNYGFTCKDGECAGSLCENFGWIECFSTGATKTKQEQQRLCKVACSPNETSSECILSIEQDKLLKYPDYQNMINAVRANRVTQGSAADTSGGVSLAPGSPCNNFQGYCDVFYRCRGVDAEGPLSRLKNLIFSPETLEDITNWIVEHWWAVLLMGVGLVLAMGLFIKFCAVHTPSSNPKAKPARKLSETMTLRRRRNQNRQNQSNSQPQQVRYPQNPQGPPPPYPGSSSHSSHMGPPHGHGKGKGRNKSKDLEMGRI